MITKQSRQVDHDRRDGAAAPRVIARISDMNFDHWRDRYGWIIGALIILMAIVIIIVQFRSTRPTRSFTLVALATGFGIGGLLFVPSVPRILTALRQFMIARAPTATSGPSRLRPSTPFSWLQRPMTQRSLCKSGILRRRTFPQETCCPNPRRRLSVQKLWMTVAYLILGHNFPFSSTRHGMAAQRTTTPRLPRSLRAMDML